MKQLEADPWDGIGVKYPEGKKITGTVTNITDYGAFVELEPGIEGLIHISEMSWTKKNVHPGKILSTSQEVEVVVLEVDPSKRRISLGLKQTLDNPWGRLRTEQCGRHRGRGRGQEQDRVSGLFIGLEGDVDGMVHLSDLDWKPSGRAGHRGIQQGRHGQGRRAGCGTSKKETHLARHQAAWQGQRRRGSHLRWSAQECRRFRRSHRRQRWWHRGQAGRSRGRFVLYPTVRPVA